MVRPKFISCYLIFGFLIISPYAWADEWFAPREVTVKSPSGLWEATVTPAVLKNSDRNEYHNLVMRLPRIGTDELPDPDMASWAKATIRLEDGEKHTFSLRSPWTPVDAVILDNGTLITFDQWHNAGYGEVCIAYSPAGNVLWSHTLEDLVGSVYMHSFMVSASSISWRAYPFRWSLEAKGEALLVNLADENRLRIQVADGKASIIEVEASDLRNDAWALYNRAESLIRRHGLWISTPGSGPVLVDPSSWEKAISLLRQAAALNPDDSDLAYNICRQLFSALKFIYRYEEAIETGKTALKRLKASNSQNGYSTNIYRMIADTQREMGLLGDMERDLRAAINEFPGDPRLSLKLADVLYESGKIQETDVVIKNLIKSTTDSLGVLLKVIGDFYESKNQREKAFRFYLDAYNKNDYPIDRSLFETLAIFYEKRLNPKEALTINQRLLEFYKSYNIKGYYLYRVQHNVDRLQSALQ